MRSQHTTVAVVVLTTPQFVSGARHRPFADKTCFTRWRCRRSLEMMSAAAVMSCATAVAAAAVAMMIALTAGTAVVEQIRRVVLSVAVVCV